MHFECRTWFCWMLNCRYLTLPASQYLTCLLFYLSLKGERAHPRNFSPLTTPSAPVRTAVGPDTDCTTVTLKSVFWRCPSVSTLVPLYLVSNTRQVHENYDFCQYRFERPFWLGKELPMFRCSAVPLFQGFWKWLQYTVAKPQCVPVTCHDMAEAAQHIQHYVNVKLNMKQFSSGQLLPTSISTSPTKHADLPHACRLPWYLLRSNRQNVILYRCDCVTAGCDTVPL